MLNPEKPESDLSELRRQHKELNSVLELKKAALEQFKAEAQAKIAKLEAEIANFAKEIEAIGARFEELMEAQDKDGVLSKRITPYMPPGTSTN